MPTRFDRLKPSKILAQDTQPSAVKKVGSFALKNRKEIGAGIVGLTGLASRFGTSREQEVAQEVLDEHLGFTSMLARYSKGQYTPADIRRVRETNRKTLNAVSGDIAQRGLGTSGAGVQVIAEAQQLPFLRLQEASIQALSGAHQTALTMATAMEGSDSFKEDFAKVVGNLTELHGIGDDATDDTVLAEMFQWLKEQWEMMNEPLEPTDDPGSSSDSGKPSQSGKYGSSGL